MAAFPSYAVLLFAGFGEQPDSALLRTTTESGPPKQSLLMSRVMVKRQVTIQLNSAADYQSFMTFFKTTISYGASWFDWLDPVDNITKQARIVAGQIQSAPMRPNLSLWRVSFQLETWSG